MALSPFYDGLESIMEVMYRDEPKPSNTSHQVLLIYGSTYNEATTLLSVLKQEARSAEGYTRGNWQPDASGRDTSEKAQKFPTKNVPFTAAGLVQIQFDSIAVMINAASKANSLITSIAGSPSTFTSANHGMSAGDRVGLHATTALPSGVTDSQFYYVIASGLTTNTFQLSETEGGAAIVTGTTWTGLLYANNANGSLHFYEYNPDNGLGDRTITILPGATHQVPVTLAFKGVLP